MLGTSTEIAVCKCITRIEEPRSKSEKEKGANLAIAGLPECLREV